MKSDENGSYVFGANGDRYEGAFRGDRREGKGRMVVSGQPEIVYEGDYKDDKKSGSFQLLDMGPKHGKLINGRFGANEELDGFCEKFDGASSEGYEKGFIYSGNFKESVFDGQGKLVHGDTGNTFEGEFFQHHKHGPCAFTLAKTGQRYRGEFEFNFETGKSDFGLRL